MENPEIEATFVEDEQKNPEENITVTRIKIVSLLNYTYIYVIEYLQTQCKFNITSLWPITSYFSIFQII